MDGPIYAIEDLISKEKTIYPAIALSIRNKEEGKINPFRKVKITENPWFLEVKPGYVAKRTYDTSHHARN